MVRGSIHYHSGRAHPTPAENTPLMGADAPPPITWTQMLKFVRPYIFPLTFRLRLVALISLFCVFAEKVAVLLPPYALKLAVDTLSTNVAEGTTNIPLKALILYIIARLISRLLDVARSYCYSLVSTDSTRRFSVDLFRHLQNLSLSFHLQRKTGEITRVMDRGIGSIDSFTNIILFTLLPT